MVSLFLPSFVLAVVLPVAPAQSSNQPQIFTQIAPDPIASQTEVPQGSEAVCLKLRVYQFQRNDGEAPRFVRETTCTAARPFAKKAKAPKARLIPAY